MMRTLLAFAVLATLTATSAEAAGLSVSSPAFAAGQPIPRQYSAYGENHSPPLAWTAIPGAKGYALTLSDPDAPMGTFYHWLVWNIPAGTTRLGEDGAHGLTQGRNGAGMVGYFGPRPPSGVHHYHFKIFALDAPLGLPAGADIDQLTAAMKGHVVAEGELVGTFAK